MFKIHGANCGIYHIINTIPDRTTTLLKIYVGSSINLKNRKWKHFNLLSKGKHPNAHLQNAYNKIEKLYPEGAAKYFEFRILEEKEAIVDKKELKRQLLFLENLELDKYKNEHGGIDHDRCYNINIKAGSNLGTIFTKEHKDRISVALKGTKKSEEFKEGCRQRNLGRKNSEKQNNLLSARMKGNKINLGRIISEEEKIKIGRANKGKKHSEETKQKLREINLGRKHTEETKNKMRKPKLRLNKKVINLTTGEIFDSLTKAGEYCGIHSSGITHACKGKQATAGGFRWSLIENGI